MQFKPNFDLLCSWDKAEKIANFVDSSPFVAVFKSNNKTLVYMADDHGLNISFDMLDHCLGDEFGIKPDVFLIEMENAGFEHKCRARGFQVNTLAYAAVRAVQKHIPIVFADLSEEEMVKIVQGGFPDKKIDSDDVHRALRNGPNPNGGVYRDMWEYLKLRRDKFMVENITTALNKYDTVFVMFGSGHYTVQRLFLEDMMGKPEYITRFKNMRGDFSDIKIEPIKLCEFKD